MIQEHSCYTLSCDRCGEDFQPDDGGYVPHYEFLDDVIAAADDHDWVTGGLNAWCPDCATPDERLRAWERDGEFEDGAGEPEDLATAPYRTREAYDRAWVELMLLTEHRSVRRAESRHRNNIQRPRRDQSEIVLPRPLGWDYWRGHLAEGFEAKVPA